MSQPDSKERFPGRADNPSKRRIRKAAFELMYETGFDAASYTEISRRSGVSRSLVQRRYPRKELFVYELVEDAVTICWAHALTAKGSQDVDLRSWHSLPEGLPSPVRVARFFQLYYSFLLWDANMRSLTRSVIANRNHTMFLIVRNCHLVLDDESFAKVGTATMLKTLGGVYEYMAYAIDNQIETNVPDLAAEAAAQLFLRASDDTCLTTLERAREWLLPQSEVERAVPLLIQEMSDINGLYDSRLADE